MSHHAIHPPDEGACSGCGTAFRRARAAEPVTVSVHAVGDRLVVTVSGELDLDSDQLLEKTLCDALDRATGGVELDLAGVEFCGCSTLNVLLQVRHRAREASKSLVLRAGSPAVSRLLALSGTLTLFTAEPVESAEPAEGDVAAGNGQLHRALRRHAGLDLARGVLMASFQLSAEQSWQVLLTVSRRSRCEPHVIADALLRTAHGEALPESLAGHVAAAVREHGGSEA